MEIFVAIVAIILLIVLLSKISSINNSMLAIRSEIDTMIKMQRKLFNADLKTTVPAEPITEKHIEIVPKKVVTEHETHEKYMPTVEGVEKEVEPDVIAPDEGKVIPPEETIETVIVEEVKVPEEEVKKAEPEKLMGDAWGYWTSDNSEKPEGEKRIEKIVENTSAEKIEDLKQETEEPIIEQPVRNIPPKKAKEEQGFDFERFFGENLLSKIGIVTLVLGIAYFIKYAIDQNWINEVARVGIGFLVGAIILGVAYKIKKQNDTFSAILAGGGIAVLYITTVFAYQEYELIPQTLAFVIMILITVFSVLLSLLYDKKELAIFSLLGGFASPLLISSGAGNYIVLFTYILILNIGMLVVAAKKKWDIIGHITYFLTLVFLWVWVAKCKDEDRIGTVIFSFLFFVQFYILAIINYLKTEKLTSISALMILGSNLSFFASSLVLLIYWVDDPSLVMDGRYRGLISVGLGLINAVPLVVLYKRDKVDTNLIFLLIAIVLSFISLSIPLMFTGRVITLFWAVETCVLLLLWIKSKQKVFGIGFFIIYLLAIVSWLMDLQMSSYSTEVFLNLRIDIDQFVSGLVLIGATFVNYLMLNKSEEERLPISSADKAGMSVKGLADLMCYLSLILLYIVPFVEIYRATSEYSGSIQSTFMITYTYTFMAIYALANWKTFMQYFFQISIFGILVFPLTLLINLRLGIVSQSQNMFWPMMTHFLGVLSVVILSIYLLKYKVARNTKTIYWLLAIVGMITVGVEAKNIATLLFATAENYYEIIDIVWYVAFPVLWGIMAVFIIMYGIKHKIPTLRKIALSILGVVILKLYLLDIWNMKPTGRIIAFIVLGIVLLFSSFLVQRVKKLISKENLEEEISENEAI